MKRKVNRPSSPTLLAIRIAATKKNAGIHEQSYRAQRRDNKADLRKGRWDDQSGLRAFLLISIGL